jgi:hypothetical protein
MESVRMDNDKLSIAEAARRCGYPRLTLQRAVRAGRLHLDAAPPDRPTLLGQPFTLCDHLAFTSNGDGDDGDMTVALSPGGEIVFQQERGTQ